MNGNILVITNNFQSSLTYTRMLAGYGYAVNEVTTTAGAKIRLRAGMIPNVIIIDMKNHTDDQHEFLNMLSEQYPNIPVVQIGTQAIHIGHRMSFLQRPAQPETILNTLNQVN